MDEIVNKVAESGLVSIDLEEYYTAGERALLDISGVLYEGLILKEKDFRDFVKAHDWKQYQDKFLAITCTTEAIVPTWAYMLLTTQAAPFAKKVVFGSLEQLEAVLYNESLSHLDIGQYKDKRIVVKGCSNLPVPVSAYVELTRLLRPVTKSIMYGEPCSTVPLFKRKD